MSMFKYVRSSAVWFGILAVLALLVPSLALAQTAGPYTVADTDLSKKIFLDYLFGPLTGAGDSPLTSIVFIFNSAMLFLGGIFAAYTIIAGTMSTAHDGQMLGQKWSSLWIPIRTTLGAAAIMPVIGGGWCAAQAIVVWLATLGIGIANTMWSAYAADPLTDAVYTPPFMATQVRDTFMTMLMNNVCVAGFVTADKQAASAGGTALQDPNDVMGVYPDAYNAVDVTQGSATLKQPVGYSYGTQSDADNAHATCGKLNMNQTFDVTGGQDIGATGYDGEYVSATGSSLLNPTNVALAIIPVQQQQFTAAQAQMAQLSYQIVNGTATQADVTAAIQNQTNAYVNAVSQAAKTAYSNSNANNANFQQSMQKDGWIMAGAFYMSIARAQDQLTGMVTALPTSSTSWDRNLGVSNQKAEGFTWAGIKDWFGEHLRTHTEPPQLVVDSMRKAYSMTQAAQRATSGGVQYATEEASDDNTGSGLTTRMMGAFTTGMSGVNAAGANTGFNQNPVIMAKNLGNAMVNWAWLALGSAASIGLISTLAADSGGGAFAILAGPFTMLFGTLIVAGASMAYYLPVLPFILWIGVVLGWAVLLVEAVIAAPLWAVVHMAPDADGVVGRGGQGYMLVLSLTLRPALMIMGLVAAISLMRPIGFLINSTFAGAFLMAQGPGSGGVTGAVAGCGIYAGVMITVINRVFGLIHVIPDRMLRWIGGGGNELGQEAEAVNQGSAGKMIAATSGAKALTESANQAGTGLAQQLAQNKSRKAADRGADLQKGGNIQDRVARDQTASANAFTQAAADPTGDHDNASRRHGENLMASGLQGAVDQAQILARSGSAQQKAAAREFLSAHQAAASSGSPTWAEDFVGAQSSAATAMNPVQRQDFHRSMMAAGEGLARSQASTYADLKSRKGGVGAARDSSTSTPPPGPVEDGDEAI